MSTSTTQDPDLSSPDASNEPVQPSSDAQADATPDNGLPDPLSTSADDAPAQNVRLTPNADNQGVLRPVGMLAGTGRMLLETGSVALPLRGLGRAFAALGHVDYRYIWCGALLSNMGMWIQTVATQWLIKTLAPDSSALWLGRAAFFQQIPTVLLLPLGGVLADRLDRRWIILAGNVFLGMVAIALTLIHATGSLRLWHLIALATVLGCWQAALLPATQSLLPTLVSKANLPNAVALNAMQFNLSRAIGPAIGGVALVALGATWSFGINAVSYLAIIVAVFLISRPPPTGQRREGVMRSLAGGASYLKQRRDLIIMLAVVFVSGFAMSPVLFMLPAVVEELFDNTPQQYSQLLSSFGIGAVLGAGLLAMRAHREASPWRSIATFALYGVLQATLSLGLSFPMALGVVFLCGMSCIGSLNRLFAVIIGSVPNKVRGRVASYHMLCITLGFPLGGILAGNIASVWGVVPVLQYYGLGLVVFMALAWAIKWKGGIEYHDDSDA